MEKKFRAWYKGDINLNKPQKFIWDRVEGDHCDFVLESDLLKNLTPAVRYRADSVFCDDDFIVEQFAGLPDKNGVDIYESDIVKIWNSFCVEVRYFGSGFVLYDSDRYTSPLWHGNEEHYEVVGNIHENSDLLTSKGE